MTGQDPQHTSQEAPHFTREWLLSALRHLRADFEAALTGESADDDRARARMRTGQALGLDALAPEVLRAIDEAVARIAALQWPGGIDVRYVALIGALRQIAEASSATMRRGPELADLSALARVLGEAELAAASGFRRRTADRLRGLYVIVDPDLTNDRDPAWVAEQAMLGGATAIQLRVKDRDKGEWTHLAGQLVQLCEERGAALIVNDHPDVAAAVGAHGVHLGQHDMALALARRALRPWQIAGTSNALADEAAASCELGADYVAVGRMFPTGSKSDTRPAGPETLRKVRELVPASGPPLVAIGGITPENVAEVAVAGADGVCVISAVTQAGEPREAAERLLSAFREARGR